MPSVELPRIQYSWNGGGSGLGLKPVSYDCVDPSSREKRLRTRPHRAARSSALRLRPPFPISSPPFRLTEPLWLVWLASCDIRATTQLTGIAESGLPVGFCAIQDDEELGEREKEVSFGMPLIYALR